MRLIDADKLHPDRKTDKGLAISQGQIAEAPAVPAIPISVIEQIKAEIEHIDRYDEKYTSMYTRPDLIDMVIDTALTIIDRHIKEYTK